VVWVAVLISGRTMDIVCYGAPIVRSAIVTILVTSMRKS